MTWWREKSCACRRHDTSTHLLVPTQPGNRCPNIAANSPLPRWPQLAPHSASRHPQPMTTPIKVSIPHQLGRAEARRRIEAGFSKVVYQLPGSRGTCSERWEGDRLNFGVTTMGQTVAGVIDVLDTSVTIEVTLPGLLGMIASGLKDRLQKVGQLLLEKK
jgi:hypothetical protein